MGSMLPFGRTQVTASEYDHLICRDEIVTHLESVGTPNPADRLTTFVQTVPDLLEWLGENGRDKPWRYTTDPWWMY